MDKRSFLNTGDGGSSGAKKKKGDGEERPGDSSDFPPLGQGTGSFSAKEGVFRVIFEVSVGPENRLRIGLGDRFMSSKVSALPAWMELLRVESKMLRSKELALTRFEQGTEYVELKEEIVELEEEVARLRLRKRQEPERKEFGTQIRCVDRFEASYNQLLVKCQALEKELEGLRKEGRGGPGVSVETQTPPPPDEEVRRGRPGVAVATQTSPPSEGGARGGGPGVAFAAQTSPPSEGEVRRVGPGDAAASQTLPPSVRGELERRVSQLETLLYRHGGISPPLSVSQGEVTGGEGPAVAPERSDSWAKVVGRKRRRDGGASPPGGAKRSAGGGCPPGPPGAPLGPVAPLGAAGGAGPRGGLMGPPRGPAPPAAPGGARSRGGNGRRRRKRKEGNTAPAVVITCRDGKYEETMGLIRATVDPKVAGVGSLRHRRTVTGALLFEVEDVDKGASAKADALASLVRDAVAGRGVLVTRPRLTEEVRISGIPDSVTVEDISGAIAGMVKCVPGDVSPTGRIIRARNGLGLLWVRLPAGDAQVLGKAGCIRIGGWVRMTVALVGPRPLRCHRCFEVGHVAAICRSMVDRSGRCYRCGDLGHHAKECGGTIRCPLCKDAGLPDGHRLGGGSLGAPAAPVEQREAVRPAPLGPDASMGGSIDPGGSAVPPGGPVATPGQEAGVED